MKLEWNEARKHFEEHTIWLDKVEMFWFQHMWQLIDEQGLTIYNSLVEKFAVYSRLYATIKIYREFCEVACEESADFDFNLSRLSFDRIIDKDDDVEEYVYKDLIEGLVCDNRTMNTIFEVIKSKFGLTTAFCSLWLTFDNRMINEIYGIFDIDDDDSDEHQEYSTDCPINSYEDYIKYLHDDSVIDAIVNSSVTGNKGAGFSWLDQNL